MSRSQMDLTHTIALSKQKAVPDRGTYSRHDCSPASQTKCWHWVVLQKLAGKGMTNGK